MTTLDRTDRKIVAELQNNARLTNKELASRVNLAPSSCLSRVQRLQRENVFRGFHTAVEPAVLGVKLEVLLFVQLAGHALFQWESLKSYLQTLDEVMSIFHIGGAEDLVLHIAAADTDHLQQVVMQSISNRPEVGRIRTSLVYDHLQTGKLPDLLDRTKDEST